MRETAVELGPRSISQTSLMILDLLVEYSSLVRRTGRVGGGGTKIRIRYGRRYLHLFLSLPAYRTRPDFRVSLAPAPQLVATRNQSHYICRATQYVPRAGFYLCVWCAPGRRE